MLRLGIAKGLPDTDSKSASATNPRGIPVAPFVDRVEDYVSSRADVDATMRSFQEMISSVYLLQSARASLELCLNLDSQNADETQ